MPNAPPKIAREINIFRRTPSSFGAEHRREGGGQEAWPRRFRSKVGKVPAAEPWSKWSAWLERDSCKVKMCMIFSRR